VNKIARLSPERRDEIAPILVEKRKSKLRFDPFNRSKFAPLPDSLDLCKHSKTNCLWGRSHLTRKLIIGRSEVSLRPSGSEQFDNILVASKLTLCALVGTKGDA